MATSFIIFENNFGNSDRICSNCLQHYPLVQKLIVLPIVEAWSMVLFPLKVGCEAKLLVWVQEPGMPVRAIFLPLGTCVCVYKNLKKYIEL